MTNLTIYGFSGDLAYTCGELLTSLHSEFEKLTFPPLNSFTSRRRNPLVHEHDPA